MSNFIRAAFVAGLAAFPCLAHAQTNAQMSGDCTANTTSVVTCTKLNNVTISLGGPLTLSGSSGLTLTTTGTTTLTLPTSGTLATTAGIATAVGAGLPSATTSQLYGGTGGSGIATPITLGTNLSISGGTLNAASGGGGGSIPATTIATSGTAQTVTFPSAGEAAYNITATGNLALTVAGGAAGTAQVLLVNVTQDSTGSRAISFTNSNINWANGPPNFPQYPGQSLTFTLYATAGSTTYAGTY